jgi:hypothetical protein
MEPVFQPLVDKIEARLSKIGLYLSNAEITAIPIDQDLLDDPNSPDVLSDPNIAIYLTSIFTVSELAWKDRVVNPELHDQNQQFKLAAPTEFEIDLESFKDEMLNWEEDEE